MIVQAICFVVFVVGLLAIQYNAGRRRRKLLGMILPVLSLGAMIWLMLRGALLWGMFLGMPVLLGTILLWVCGWANAPAPAGKNSSSSGREAPGSGEEIRGSAPLLSAEPDSPAGAAESTAPARDDRRERDSDGPEVDDDLF